METLIDNLYELLAFEPSEKGVEVSILLNPAHPIFKGHFPGNPVMPGVCMIQIMKEMTEKAVGKNLFLSRSSNIKFMSIINPDTHPELNLSIEINQLEDEVSIKASAKTKDAAALKMRSKFLVSP